MITRKFNTTALQQRRRQLGRSTQGLARHLDASAATIRAIEGGSDPAIYELGFLDQLAAALGLHLNQLFEQHDNEPQPREDNRNHTRDVIGIVQSSYEPVTIDSIAAAIDTDPYHVRLTLDSAVPSLQQLGLVLVWHGDIAVQLAPDTTVTTVALSAARTRIETDGLSRSEARIVAAVVTNTQRSRSEQRITAHTIVGAGILDRVLPTPNTRKQHGIREALELSANSRFNLVLDEYPTQPPEDH